MNYISKPFKVMSALFISFNALFFLTFLFGLMFGKSKVDVIAPVIMSASMIFSVIYVIFLVFHTIIFFLRRNA